MAEYLDNIFTDEDLSSKEFINEISKELSDITGYQDINENNNSEKNDDIDPLDEVLKKEIVEITEVKRNIIENLTNEEKVRILKKPRTKASIAIDDAGNIICKSWGNYYISGNNDTSETAAVINDYLKECEKPIKDRHLERFIVGKKNVVEKFNDMNLHKGSFELNDFFENVV